MVAQGKWSLWGVPDKEKSQLIRRRWGTDTTAEVLGAPERKSACLLGPPWLINRDMSHQRLGHLELFQNLGQCFSSIAKRLKFGEGVAKSVPETDFFFLTMTDEQRKWQNSVFLILHKLLFLSRTLSLCRGNFFWKYVTDIHKITAVPPLQGKSYNRKERRNLYLR